MIRPIAFCAGLVLSGVAQAQSLPNNPLCVHGHPARRAAHVIYGGLPHRPGYQRDHYISLGLGGSDIRANVHYQRCDRLGLYGRCEAGPAADKDNDEHKAEENMCGRAHWSPDYARQWLAHNWPLDSAHGYDDQ